MSSNDNRYAVHDWCTHSFSFDEFDAKSLPLEPCDDYRLCHSDGPDAYKFRDHSDLFYVDLECIAAGTPPTHLCSLHRLTDDWRAHSSSDLVMKVIHRESLLQGKIIIAVSQ